MTFSDKLSIVLPDSLTFMASKPSDESLGCHQSPYGLALRRGRPLINADEPRRSKVLVSGMALTPAATLIGRYGKRFPGEAAIERAVRHFVDPGILLMGMWLAGLACWPVDHCIE